MKLLSYLMKLLYLMTLPSQQFCLCDTLFNVYDTLMKYALRLALWLQANKKFIHPIHPNKHTALMIMSLHMDGRIPSF